MQVIPAHGWQLTQTTEVAPSWLVWKVFYDSLSYYAQRSPNKDGQILKENFSLTSSQASLLLNSGHAFLAELQRLDDEARAEANKRYKYSTVQSGPPQSGNPRRRPGPSQKSPRERALEDGLYAKFEAQKNEVLTKHLLGLKVDIGAIKFSQVTKFLSESIAPSIKKLADADSSSGKSGFLPAGVTRPELRMPR